jgi:hypothetical protein
MREIEMESRTSAMFQSIMKGDDSIAGGGTQIHLHPVLTLNPSSSLGVRYSFISKTETDGGVA